MPSEPASQSPSGNSSGSISPESPVGDASAESEYSTSLQDPDLPYAGFTWTEAGIILGVVVLTTAITVASLFTGPPCCGPSSQREFILTALNRAGTYLLLALTALPVFWACVRLRPQNVGWGTTLAAHSALALIIPFWLKVSREALVYGMVNAWPPADGGTPSPPDPLEILMSAEFLDELVPYVVILGVGLVRAGYLRSRARREEAKRLEQEAKQLRSQLTEARLESLRMQINPHFFHNTLHTISTMAGRDPDGVRQATARLSDMMRHVLSTSDKQEIALEEELDVLQSYLDIQKLRLDDRLEVTMEIEPDARRALVPTLLLQPLAENAVKHGFEGNDETGHLQIRAAREEDTLVLEVSDDGSGLAPGSPISEGDGKPSELRTADGSLGLENIAERLNGLYGHAASLTFEESDGGGLRVLVRLPYRPSEPDSDLRTSGVVAD